MSGFRKTKLLFILAILLIIVFAISLGFARDKDGKVRTGPLVMNKPLVPDTYNSTVANLWSKLTNFGWIGDDHFDNPSFESPGGSGNHYLYQGSIWVAGKDPTGIVHCTSPDEEEIALTTDPDDVIRFFSADDPRFENRPNVDPVYEGKQVSAEDTWATYTDLDPGRHNAGEGPLGLRYIERTYKWTASYNDDFFIFDYQIINIGLDSDGDGEPDTPQDLTEIHVGIRFDADVSYLAGGEYWYDDLTNYYPDAQLSYLFDGDDPDVPGNDEGEYGVSEGYIYARLLKAESSAGVSYTDPVSHSWWTIDDDPTSEDLKFAYMSTPNYAGQPASPYDYRFLQTTGPFDLAYGDTLNVVWALGVGHLLDGAITDSDWARRIFDAGFKAAAAPDAPILATEPGEGFLKLSWDNSAEDSRDPLTGEQDFEGYRVYKSSRVDDAGNNIWVKLADFDLVNEIGANTGLKYEYSDRDVIQGVGYSYAITSYDKGDPAAGLPALESSKRAESASTFLYVSGPARNTVDEVYAYPNPYPGSAEWDHVLTFNEPYRRKMVFANLPAGYVKVNIFTLSGDHVATVDKEGDQSIAIWTLLTKNNQKVASGIYLYVVESPIGEKVGKFVILQ